MHTLRRRGIVVVFISHNMQNVLDVCTRVVVMRHGAVAADLEVAGLTARDVVDHITGIATSAPAAAPVAALAALVEEV